MKATKAKQVEMTEEMATEVIETTETTEAIEVEEVGNKLATLPSVEDVGFKPLLRSQSNRSIKNLWKNKKNVRFDLAIQRNFVWNLEQCSNLIDSIFVGFAIPAVFMQVTEGKILQLLDGKQRIGNAIFRFLNDEYALSVNIQDVTYENVDGKQIQEEVAGKKFSELSKDLQDKIMDYELTVVQYENMTIEQRDEFFQRINAGSPLTKVELTRALAGGKTMEFIEEVNETEFFKDMVAIADSQRNRFVDNELIMQIMMLLTRKTETGVSPKEVNEYVVDLKEAGISDELKETILNTTQYITEAFKVKVQEKDSMVPLLTDKQGKFILKKVHTPMLFVHAVEAIKRGIPVEKYAQWVKFFFYGDRERKIKGYKSGEGAYGSACSHGSAKKDMVTRRLTAMGKHFNAYFASSEEIEAGHKQSASAVE